MLGLGFQELLILLLLLGVIVLGVVLTKKGKFRIFAALFGLCQGLLNIGFGILGGPPEFHPQDQLVAVVGVALMILQGVAMLVFSVATYKSKLWGAYGLLVVAVLFAAISLYTTGKPGWLIPLLIYLGAVVSIHRARTRAIERSSSADTRDSRTCPRCGAGYKVSDYRADAPSIFCSSCRAEIPRS